MQTNIGSLDRACRIIAGIALIAWTAYGGPVWGWLGIVPLLTGLIRFCPLYRVLGVNSCDSGK